MRKIIIIIITVTVTIALLLFKKCSIDDKSREDHRRTTIICDNLYVETFCTFGQGALGGDRDSEWLTDSINFRIFIGTFDESEGGFSFKCSGDTVFITQRPDSIAGNPKKASVTTFYKISDLQKKQNVKTF